MKKLIIPVLAFLFSLPMFSQGTLPDVTLKDIDGNSINVSKLSDSGKIVVLNFWATWCGPCVKELGNLNDIIEDWKKNYDIIFVAVSVDNSRTTQKVKPFVDGKGWYDYLILLDVAEELKRAMNVLNPPYTFLFDKTGKLAYSHEGYQDGAEIELEEKIIELVGAHK